MDEDAKRIPPDLIDKEGDMAEFVLDIILGDDNNTAQQMPTDEVARPVQRGSTRLSTLREGFEYHSKEGITTEGNESTKSNSDMAKIGYLRQTSSQAATFTCKPAPASPLTFQRSVSVNDAKISRPLQSILPFGTYHMASNQMPDASMMTDLLGVGPRYKQEEKERWTSAAQLYQEMLSQCNTPDQGSPPESRNSLTNVSAPVNIDKKNIGTLTPANTPNQKEFTTQLHSPKGPELSDELQGSPSHNIAYLPYSINNAGNMNMLNQPEPQRLPSGILTPNQVLSGACRSTLGSASESRGEFANSLELEAIAAVHELSFAVDQIAVSEMLPRTPELIFVNVTTVEGKPYCMELTFKGWRVCSTRHDCMLGDWQLVTLHAQYFETIYSLMDEISPQYRQRFGERLAQRLRQLQTDNGGVGCTAPSSSYINPRATGCEGDQSLIAMNRRDANDSSGSLRDSVSQSNSGPNFMALSNENDKLNFPPVTINVRHPSGSSFLNEDDEEKMFNMEEHT